MAAYAPPAVIGAARDGRFVEGAAFLRGGVLHGGCVAAWPGAIDDDPARRHEINLQIYDLEGGMVGDVITAATVSNAFDAQTPLIAALDRSRFALAWIDGSDPLGAFRFSVYDVVGPGAPQDVVVQTPNVGYGAPHALARSICRLGKGVAVIWTVYNEMDFGAPEIAFLQFFGDDGAPLSPAKRLPAPAMLGVVQKAAGCIVAVWTEPDPAQAETCLVRAQRYDETGEEIGPRIAVAEGASSAGATPIGLSDGGFVLLWRGPRTSSIRGRRFSAKGQPTTSMFFMPRGASEAAEWGDYATVRLSPKGALVAQWLDQGDLYERAVRMLPAKISPVRD